MTERLARAAGGFLERRLSRRGLLARMALGGSALAVAPSYLVRPGTAEAAIRKRPTGCRPGTRCADGYTAFCCEIARGGSNHCPSHTYIAGWWKCTDYRGHGLCGREGVRYYVDCNRTPGEDFGGCRCARGDCDRRRVGCNAFRYGQCNTQVPGSTEVACRLVVCQHPAEISGFNCNRTYKQDDNTCVHDAPCLKGAVGQLPGAGGA
jgi:hypothetical protein